MGERVALYGGDLTALPRPEGGFEVRARIPYDGIGSSLQVSSAPAKSEETVVAAVARMHWPWLDPLLAGVLLAVLETGVLASGHLRGPLVLNVTAVAAMAIATLWRRRSPLLVLITFGTIATIMNNYLTPPYGSPIIGPVILLIPIYSVAAWEHRRRAIMGLAVLLSGTAVANLIVRHGAAGDFVGAAFAITAAWASGRAIRARRQLVSDLKLLSARLAAEREDRARLVVASERMRIGRELHGVVAQRVAAMVVQAEAARSLLDVDSVRADAAMSATEDTGRQVLTEMRRMLGILRAVNDVGERQPQPGLDQIYALIQRERERGQPIELSVLGEPGTLPAGVDLGTYRIIEEALQSVRQQSAGLVGVTLRFSEESFELHLIARCSGPSHWPTDAMQERVALCGGELRADREDANNWQLVAHMPRRLHGVLA
jgi:signal transduction histidine kinase